MFAEVLSGMVQGIEGELITVQADISDGLPVFGLTGNLAAEAREAKERVRTALKNTGYRLPPKRVSVNLAPSDVRKSGTCYDLAIAVGVLTAMGFLPKEKVKGILFLGELALDGALSPFTGALAILKAAWNAGYNTCVVPFANVQEASLLPGMNVLGFFDLKEVAEYFMEGERGRRGRDGVVKKSRDKAEDLYDKKEAELPDLSAVKGQKMAKRALEIAVAGYHNLFLDGPPGAGKSMLASCVPGIMPEMTESEKIDVTMIYSVKGLLRDRFSLIAQRPFRAPSPSATMAGMFGGGRNPSPGEVTLAHHGVLFVCETLCTAN